jgi:glutathione synthase
MKIAFLMDRLETINPVNETTSHLMYECNQRGHSVFFLEPHDVYIRGNALVARMHDVTTEPSQSIRRYWQTLIRLLKKDHLIFETIRDLDVLFLRKNPPLDYRALEFLSPINKDVFILNATYGQLQANSKLYTLNFPDIIPETHVSRDPVRLRKIIENFGGSMVVKPLQRFGGEGVIKVSTQDRENLASLINFYVGSHRPYPEREPIMVQEYLSRVSTEGDVRILMLNGEILGAMRRKPQGEDFRTNIHAGARAYHHEITEEEEHICRTISNRLVEDGLYFVGIDVIGDKLVEVNVVSPGGIPRINKLNETQLEKPVIDFLEDKVRQIKYGARNSWQPTS